jgi:hypothetical protein
MPLPPQLLLCLEQLDTDQRRMPATVLYNEGWMLRLLLDAGERGLLPNFMPRGVRWFSEGQLRTPFGQRGSGTSESNTRADGVFGDFKLVGRTRSGIDLESNARRFVVLEAKLYAPLSTGTKNAPGYDQVARTVACMANTLHRAGLTPDTFEELRFVLLVPKETISDGGIPELTADSIRRKIDARINQFGAPPHLQKWRDVWAWPLLARLERGKCLQLITWDSVLGQLTQESDRTELKEFYESCKGYNHPPAALSTTGRPPGTAFRPQRGRVYQIASQGAEPVLVRVCTPGPVNSRVYRLNGTSEPYLVPNSDLAEAPEEQQSPPPLDPVPGKVYWWKRPDGTEVRVRVRNTGSSNSRVLREGQTGRGFKVPNHRLRPADQGGSGPGGQRDPF